MSFKKSEDGTFIFECDECGEELDTRIDHFGRALVEMKEQGWVAQQDKKGAYNHFCEGCTPQELHP